MTNIYNHNLIFVNIKNNYLNFLHQFDIKVPQEHTNAKRRPFIGIVFNMRQILYFVPLASPKAKFKHLNNKVDFFKLRNGELGALNFNNMIPVNEQTIDIYDIDNEKDTKYKNLILKQARYLNRRQNDIKKKAYRLYEKFINNKLDINTKNRCCDFQLLEAKLLSYLNSKNAKK